MQASIERITQLSDLEESPAPVLFGVVADGECFTPPRGLTAIGLHWKGSAPDSIDDTLIDTVISFTLAGVEVILEICPEDAVDPAYAMTLAGNAGVSIAIVPPKSEDGIMAWGEKLEAFVDAFLSTPNFASTLYPVSGYLSYLIAERMAGVDRMDPKDPYVRARFIDAVPEDWSDAVKARMRAAFIRKAGGEDELGALLDQLVTAIRAEAEKIILNEHQASPNL